MDYFVLEDDDPATMHAKIDKVKAEFDDGADGDEIWEDFTETLTYALLAIASENLLRSLKRRVVLKKCDEKFSALLGRMECLYGKDVSEVTVPTLMYFSRGIIVSYWDQMQEAEISFASEEREQAFLQRFPQARHIEGK